MRVFCEIIITTADEVKSTDSRFFHRSPAIKAPPDQISGGNTKTVAFFYFMFFFSDGDTKTIIYF